MSKTDGITLSRTPPAHLPYVDTLRGIAIALVMAVHTSQALPDIVGTARSLLDQGARGVQLFFVASSLTLIVSWKHRNETYWVFWLRRIFRIVPMFYLGIFGYLLIEGFSPRYFAPDGITWGDVALTSIFLNGWNPLTLTSVVHGGWSIVVEMTFYLIFPFLVKVIKSLNSAFVAFVIVVLVAKVLFEKMWELRSTLWPGVSDDLASTFVNLWFPNQLPVFIVGFVLFYALERFQTVPRWLSAALLVVSGFGFVLLSIIPGLSISLGANIYTAFGFDFGLFAFSLARGGGNFLVNRISQLLGKVSYSAYLWHFYILSTVGQQSIYGITPLKIAQTAQGIWAWLILFVIVLLETAAISFVTYKMVERPFVKLGNILISKLTRPSTIPAKD